MQFANAWNFKQLSAACGYMRDLPIWLNGPPGASVLRQLRNLARMLPGAPREGSQAVIILTPAVDIPAELSGHAIVVGRPVQIVPRSLPFSMQQLMCYRTI